MTQKVSDVMTSVPVSVPSEASLVDVARFMREHGIGDVLVMEEGRLRGVLTDRDIVVRAVAAERDVARTPAGDVCSREIVTVAPGDDAESAVRLMRERAVRRLPVVDGDRPVGVVSIGDMALERDSQSVLAKISAEPPNM
jgi:CBS domain-containing protein